MVPSCLFIKARPTLLPASALYQCHANKPPSPHASNVIGSWCARACVWRIPAGARSRQGSTRGKSDDHIKASFETARGQQQRPLITRSNAARAIAALITYSWHGGYKKEKGQRERGRERERKDATQRPSVDFQRRKWWDEDILVLYRQRPRTPLQVLISAQRDWGKWQFPFNVRFVREPAKSRSLYSSRQLPPPPLHPTP